MLPRLRPFFLVLLPTFTLALAFGTVTVTAEKDDFRPKPVGAGPWVKATRGEIWPKPQYQQRLGGHFLLDAENFHFKPNPLAKACDIIQKSFPRFYQRMFPGFSLQRQSRQSSSGFPKILRGHDEVAASPILGSISVLLESPQGCQELPHPRMNETYEIRIEQNDSSNQYIQSPTVWGLLRGLESFTQLVYTAKENNYAYQVDSVQLIDFPRFPHRGFMVDSSRHFLSKSVLLKTLDLMEMNKMNVFHWHLSDNSAFPYQSVAFPRLSDLGAYEPETHVYTPEDVRHIIDAARRRGIRVIPEFDTPGHTQSWELGQPGLLTRCFENGVFNGLYGPMDPTKESVYAFLTEFYKEIHDVFPDEYVHIGGDEVNLKCWESNPRVNDLLRQWNITRDYRLLESYFVERVLEIVENLPTRKRSIVWQEVFDNRDKISADTIVEVWKSWGLGWKKELEAITANGQPALLSAPWYLNYPDYGSDWTKMYESDPHDFDARDPRAKTLVLGGEACVWSEFVNSINLIPRSWPRSSAVAERLWSSRPDTQNLGEAAARLQEHECRMLARGYSVQPAVGAGFCPVKWN